MMNIEETIQLIQQLHEGQTDLSGFPYWTHPVAVMNLLPDESCDADRIAALLHDVVEDTTTTIGDLRAMGFTEEVLEMVELLTRRPEKGTYMEWIKGIVASGNQGALRVKLADIWHNSDSERIARISDHAKRADMDGISKGRYMKARAILGEQFD